MVIGLAGTTNVPWLAVGFFGIRLLGQGALSLASKTMVAIHFRAGLGRAVGITGAIAAVGMAIVPVVLAAIIDAGGWRLAWLLGGASLWAVVIPVTQWALPKGADRPEREDEAEAAHAPTHWSRGMAMRTPMFWVITLGGASASLIITGLTFHQISILGAAGLSPTAAAANFLPQTVASVSAVAAVGVLSDRLPPRRLLISAMALLVLGVLLIPVLAVPLVPIGYAAALGAGLGSTQALEGALYVRYFGVHAIGAIRGAAFAVTVAAAALGPVLVGLGHELTGSYTAALAMLGLPLLVGAAAAVVQPPHESAAWRPSHGRRHSSGSITDVFRKSGGAPIGALMNPVSCVSWRYSVDATETHETLHQESGMRYHSHPGAPILSTNRGFFVGAESAVPSNVPLSTPSSGPTTSACMLG